MAWLPGWLSGKRPREERRLERLEHDIHETERRLERRRRGKARTLQAVRLYALAGAILFALYTYFFHNGGIFSSKAASDGGGSGAAKRYRRLVTLPLVGAFASYTLYKLAALWYNWLIDRADDRLSSLREKKLEIIEELKRRTRYYETRQLLEKYGESTPSQLSTPSPSPCRSGERALSSSPSAAAAAVWRSGGGGGSGGSGGDDDDGSEHGSAGGTASAVGGELTPAATPSRMERITGRVVDLLAGQDSPSEREMVLLQELDEAYRKLTAEQRLRQQLQREYQRVCGGDAQQPHSGAMPMASEEGAEAEAEMEEMEKEEVEEDDDNQGDEHGGIAVAGETGKRARNAARSTSEHAQALPPEMSPAETIKSLRRRHAQHGARARSTDRDASTPARRHATNHAHDGAARVEHAADATPVRRSSRRRHSWDKAE